MKYIKCVETDRGCKLDDGAYSEYFRLIRDKLPPQVKMFAEAEWHYDFKNPKCPHDSWVERVVITESSDGVAKADRGLEIHVTLLGAYHDGLIELLYLGVYSYQIRGRSGDRPRSLRPHGDWLIDEIRMSDDGHIIHEVEFERATWEVE